MQILGIETSCDETAAAVVEATNQGGDIDIKLLSNVVASQIDIHRAFGGVVPEVAARSHVEVIMPVIEKALFDAFGAKENRKQKIENRNSKTRFPISDFRFAQSAWRQIDAIAVTYGPGLPGALLVGVQTAKTLAIVHKKPLYPIDHVEAHAYANWLTKHPPKFPLLGLIVSGGHSQLVLWEKHFKYQILGQTLDDAVGEAFDKVAKMLGLGFPGGPAVAEAALSGNADKYQFPEAKLEGKFDFSFSGLKTAVLRHLQNAIGKDHTFASHKLPKALSQKLIQDTAASFQKAAVNTLVGKTLAAYHQYQPRSVIIAGGVAANKLLRQTLAEELPLKIEYAPGNLCTDNAAMIATLGAFRAKAQKSINPLKLETSPSLSM